MFFFLPLLCKFNRLGQTGQAVCPAIHTERKEEGGSFFFFFFFPMNYAEIDLA